jgi:hypothetical protein
MPEFCIRQPFVQTVFPVLDHAMEAVEQIARNGQIRHGRSNDRDRPVRATAFDRVSRSVVIMRAMRRADGACWAVYPEWPFLRLCASLPIQ